MVRMEIEFNHCLMVWLHSQFVVVYGIGKLENDIWLVCMGNRFSSYLLLFYEYLYDFINLWMDFGMQHISNVKNSSILIL